MENSTTLSIGRYTIPDGCTAFVGRGMVTVRPKLSRKLDRDCGMWCGDCKHYQSNGHRAICRMRPKLDGASWYPANRCDIACELFEKGGGS